MSGDVIPILEETRIWMYLRGLILEEAMHTRHYGSMTPREPSDEVLTAFMLEHWPTHAPRQTEVATHEQRIKVLEREVEQRGAEIKRLNTLIAEWKRTQ